MKKFAFLTLLLCAATPAARGDVVTDWNNTLLQAIRTGNTNPPVASRNMAMVHTAIYDAVNSIEDRYNHYAINANVPATTSREAAAAQAARDVLASLYTNPAQTAIFDAALATHLNAIPAGAAKTDGINLGSAVANTILGMRATDGSSTVLPYTPSGQIGDWAPTPPAFAPALLPNWGNVTGWSLDSQTQFRITTPPPAINTPAYTAAFNEVKAIGSATSVTRTAEQTDIAKFWADGGGTSTPPGHWNKIAQTVATAQGNTLSENARLFAVLNIAEADAAIICWDNKFTHDYWRPVTAIRAGDSDGNNDTVGDGGWSSLIPTPPFPTYTSGHSTFSGAAATVLANFFGTDNITFTTNSEWAGAGAPIANRTFTSFSDAAEEAAARRLYGGIHWSFDNNDGMANGIALGNFVFATQIPEPSTSLMAALGLGGLAMVRRRRRSAA